MKSSLGILIQDFSNISEKLNQIKSSFKTYDDFVIFTDFFINNNKIYNYSIFSTFYMKFFQGNVLFLDEKSYEEHKDNIVGQAILYRN
jgi:hypothetical protein